VKFSDADRQRILSEARSTLLDATMAERRREESPEAAPAPEPPIEFEDTMTKYRRQNREQEQRFAKERAMHRETDAMRDRRLKAELAQMLAAQKDFLIEVCGEAIAQLVRGVHDEIERQVGEQIGKLRAELNERHFDRADESLPPLPPLHHRTTARQ
jgi:hypothetical protein